MKAYGMRKIVAFALFVLLLIALPLYYYMSQRYEGHTIVLGMSGPLEGGEQSVGHQFLMGAETYFRNLNDQGGVHGRSIHISAKDDRYEPRLALENVQELIEQEKVFTLFGVIGTPAAEAIFPLVKEKRIPFVGAYSGAEFLRYPENPLVLNARASDRDEIEKIIHYFADTHQLKRFALFYQNDTYGRAGVAAVKEILARRNLSLCAEGSYKRNTLSVGNALYEIEQGDPEVILMMGATAPVAEFIKRSRKSIKIRDTASFGLFSFVEPTHLMRLLDYKGERITFAQVVPSPWTSEVIEVKHYRQLMKKYHPNEPLSYTSLEGYFAARMISEVFKTVGEHFTKESFIKELHNFSRILDEKGISKNRDERCHCLHRVHLIAYVDNDFFSVGSNDE